jgi:4'-phosphopantetheinyl transferase EntD
MTLQDSIRSPRLSSRTKVQALFGVDVITAEALPELVDEQLYADERAHVSNAVPKRRAEFGTARVCARRALAQLGLPPVSLVPYEDRAPRWPDNTVGSISHTKNYCAVAVALASSVRSLGLDVEEDRALDFGVVKAVCTPSERRSLTLNQDPSHDAVLYFGAKEAFYKCQYPLTRTFLDFQDVELDLDIARGTFRVRVIKPLPARPEWFDRLTGRFIRRDGLVLCGLELH